MWKTLLAGTAALGIAGTSLVYAQQRDHGPAARWRPSQEDRAAFTDARIAALKAGLRLTPDQDKLWPAYETALRDIAKAHLERRAAHQGETRPADPIERLRRQAETMTAAGASLKRLADAQEPLFQSLDAGQKNRFQMLSRMLTGHRAHFAQMHGRDGRGFRADRHRDGEGRPGMRSQDRPGGPGGPRGMHRGEGTSEQL